MTLKERILDCLDEGAATSEEIATELGLQLATVSAVLCQLRDDGMITPVGRFNKGKSFLWDYVPKETTHANK